MPRQVKFDRWQRVALGALGLLLAYGLALRALDTASLWLYGFCLALLGLSIWAITRAARGGRVVRLPAGRRLSTAAARNKK